MKTCDDCERTLPLHTFNTNRARKDGKDSLCRTCRSLRAYGSKAVAPHPIAADPVTAAYIAGLIDGEGSIRLRFQVQFHLEINVTNTHRGILEWLQATLGGNIVNHQPETPVHRPSWRWVTGAKRARAILAAVRPYLRIKKRHAEIALEFYERIPAYKEDRPGGLTIKTLQDPLLALYLELLGLNRRGLHRLKGPHLNSTP